MAICIKLAPEYYQAILAGKKTHEGRLNTIKHGSVRVGDILRIEEHGPTGRFMERKVGSVTKFATFREMLERRYQEFIPTATNLDVAIAAYRQFYSEADELCLGVVAIGL